MGWILLLLISCQDNSEEDMRLFQTGLSSSEHTDSNPPNTTVPTGSPSVQIISDNLLIANNPSIPDYRWYGRSILCDLKNGIWVLTYSNAASHPDCTYSQIMIRFSDDYGETWTDENKYLDGSSVTGFPAYPPGGEPAISTLGPGENQTYLMPNGDIIMHMWLVRYGAVSGGTYQMRSTDGGRTWSAPDYVTYTGIANPIDVFCTDDYFELDGVIYIGARMHDSSGVPNNGAKNMLLKTEDNAVTWEWISDISDMVTYPTIEVGLEYVGNNTIVTHLRGRGNQGTVEYEDGWLRFSNDMGATWEAITHPESLQILGRQKIKSRSHVANTDNSYLDPVLISHGFETVTPPGSTPRRLGVYVSKDFGETWSSILHLKEIGFDGGYGDFLYNPIKGEYVTVQYYAPTSYYDGEIRQINWKLNWE